MPLLRAEAEAMILDDDTLRELTGYKRGAEQCRWLKANGFKFRQDCRGRPRVDRSHYLARMGGAAGAAAASSSEPNWAAMSDA